MIRGVRQALAFATGHFEEDVSLASLAKHARMSPFHFHRAFSAFARETPKQFMLRLRLVRAAALLLTGDSTVLEIALDCGFQNHEVFCRAFRRQFRMTPSSYRKRGFTGSLDRAQARKHADLALKIAPCIRLFRMSEDTKEDQMPYTIVKKQLSLQPVLIVRRRVKRSDIAAVIGESLPLIFAYAQQNGIALAGLPFTRYVEMGPGLITMEPGMRVTGKLPAGQGEIIAETLPGGPAVTTIHAGAYDKLSDAYAAIERWMEAEKLASAGAPWEEYLNDPSEHPDPKDWKTEVFWPVKS